MNTSFYIPDQNQFKKYSSRFFELFSVDKPIDLIVSAGNHDIGFHDRVVYYPFLRDRFEAEFNSSLVELKRVNGINVVNVNSMAMDGDGCELCEVAKLWVDEISSKLFERCRANRPKQANKWRLCEEERPILLSHFPLFRTSDLDCVEPDSDYNPNEKTAIRPRLGCLTKRSTEHLLRKLQPRLSLNGHTHYGCVKKHTVKLAANEYLAVNEHTLSSFNYRNRPNPSFLLLLANANELKVARCMIPNENYLFLVYFLTTVYVLQSLLLRR